MKHGGWYQIAFEHELEGDLTSVSVGGRRLIVARIGDSREVFDATCPHRGFDLGKGGTFVGDRVVKCPFHGNLIGLGRQTEGGYCVREYRSISFAGLIIAMFGEFEDGTLPAMLERIGRTHKVFPGFQTPIKAEPELLMENPFDWSHFVNVHHLLGAAHSEAEVEDGVLTTTTRLKARPSAWEGSDDGAPVIEVPMVARMYGPSFSIIEIASSGDHPHYVIGSAVPQHDGSSILRLSVALPRGRDGSDPSAELADILIRFEKKGLEQDRAMWENLDLSMRPKLTHEDRGIVAYQKFCKRFELNDSH